MDISTRTPVFETNHNPLVAASRTANPAGRPPSYPPPSTAAHPIWQRLERPATIAIDPREARQIHKLIRKGIDPIHYGMTRVRVDQSSGEEIVQKAAWRCTSETYNRNTIRYGTRQKTYTRELHYQHLSGVSDDFFCGQAPSGSQNGWQWALLDIDNRGDDFPHVAHAIKELFPELYFEPSTSGKGLHAVVRISHFNQWRPLEDREMHDLVVSWCGRLTRATKAISGRKEGSFCELKGACCYWNKSSESWTLGTLGRLPRLPLSKLRSIPVISQASFEQRLGRLEGVLEGVSEPLRDSETARTPPSAVRKAPKAKRVQRRPLPTPEQQPDAYKRMTANACTLAATLGRTPTPEELLAFYEAGPSANSEATTPARRDRATKACRFLATVTPSSLRHKSGAPPTTFDLEKHHAEISEIPDTDLVVPVGKNALRKRQVAMSRQELGVVYGTILDNFFRNENHRCARNGIQAVWDIAVRKGIIRRAFRNTYYQAAIRILSDAKLIQIVVEHTKPWEGMDGSRINGKARTISPGPCSSRWGDAQPILAPIIASLRHKSGAPLKCNDLENTYGAIIPQTQDWTTEAIEEALKAHEGYLSSQRKHEDQTGDDCHADIRPETDSRENEDEPTGTGESVTGVGPGQPTAGDHTRVRREIGVASRTTRRHRKQATTVERHGFG